jgi:hypothetical protein
MFDDILSNKPTANDQPIVRVRWLIERLRSHAADCTAMEWFGQSDPGTALADFAELLVGYCHMIEATPQEMTAAGRAAWKAGRARALAFTEQLSKAIWPLAKAGASGAEIIEKAMAVRGNFAVYVGDDFLIERCRSIAHATQPKPQRRPRHVR